MVFSFFSLIIFFGILFFFGWQLAQYFLKENRIEYLIGLSGIFGIGFYIFFVNAIGHFISIKIVFYLVLLLFFILGLGLFYFNRSQSLEWQIARSWRKILLGTFLLLVVTSGIVSFRNTFDGSSLRAPTATTIAEGNFPPVEIWNPVRPISYHYAPELFYAAIHKVTRLPLYLAYNFQSALLVGILFLLGFILIKRFCNNNFKAFISSLLMLYAGSLVFLRGIKGIPILYKLYILHQETSAPFKFFSDAFESEFSIPVLKNMLLGISWATLAFPLIIAIIYLYFCLVGQKANKIAFLLPGILLALLALAAEPYFAVLSLILFVYPFAFGLIKKDWKKSREFLLISFLILIIALPVAFVQGGVLTGVFAKLSSGVHYTTFSVVDIETVFKINKTPWLLYSLGFPIYHPKFLLEWGLLLILLIPALIFLFKKHFQLSLFLAASLIIFFLTPLFIIFGDYPLLSGLLLRLFRPVNLLGGLVVGLFLGSLYLSLKKIWLKRAVLLIIIILMTQGLLFQLLYLSIGYPPGVWNANAKFYAKPNSFEGKAYGWVKTNTSIKDYFLIVKKDDYAEVDGPNYRFVLNTGRMAPIYAYYWRNYKIGNWRSFPEPFLEPDLFFKKIIENCDSSAIKNLKYSYLYVNEEWQEGLEEKCLLNNALELKFAAGEGDKFVRIYIVNQ